MFVELADVAWELGFGTLASKGSCAHAFWNRTDSEAVKSISPRRTYSNLVNLVNENTSYTI